MSYIYGAAVQGIQQFIFQTNELKDIVGASELVEEICGDRFVKLLIELGIFDEDCTIINAAGNIKYEFKKREDCEKVVRLFPKMVVELAPGITISQAVVAYEESNSFVDAINELERRLRAQRNKPMASITVGLMGIKRSHKTNMPVVEINCQDYLDQATLNKRNASKGNTLQLSRKAFGDDTLKIKNLAIDPEQMTQRNDWVAVIHADGNGLGQIVQRIGTNRVLFKDFSRKLDRATTEAAIAAYDDVEQDWKRIPIRPIVLGGDDFTIICRADIALEYATSFIKHFERKTAELLGEIICGKKGTQQVFSEGEVRDRLTACAGIAYVKSSYPFYYAYELAEALCSRAKKDAKNKDSIREGKEIAPSCIMFHKVQDSFVESYEEIAHRELELADERTFEFGPYYINGTKEGRWDVDTLVSKAKLIEMKGKDGNAVKSHLRNWMSLMKEGSTGMAEQKLKRVKNIVTDRELQELVECATTGKRIPAYDILTIHTINTQQTKED